MDSPGRLCPNPWECVRIPLKFVMNIEHCHVNIARIRESQTLQFSENFYLTLQTGIQLRYLGIRKLEDTEIREKKTIFEFKPGYG